MCNGMFMPNTHDLLLKSDEPVQKVILQIVFHNVSGFLKIDNWSVSHREKTLEFFLNLI